MSQTETSAHAGLNEWEPYEGPASPRGRALLLLWVVALEAPWIVLAIAIEGVAWAAAVIGAGLAGWVAGQRLMLLASGDEAQPDQHSRLINLATGLARDLGMTPPRLFVSKQTGPNAFVVRGALTVTNDLLDSYTRTELEAVVAHCLVRLRDGGLGWALAAAATGVRTAAPRVDRYVDARAVAVTRYPPGLAAAIRKATPAKGRTAPLYFVADAPSHAPASERVAELLDL